MEEYDERLKICIDKIDAGVKLDDDELEELPFWSNEDIEGDSGHLDQIIKSIIEYNGRFFSLHWRRGLTEYQENWYGEQPVEVQKIERQKTITVTEYIPVKQKSNKAQPCAPKGDTK